MISLLEIMIEGDPGFAVRFLNDAMKRWPLSLPSKQPIFLNLVTFLLERTVRNLFPCLIAHVFGFLARCMRSSHALVVTLALRIWSNAKIAPNIATNAAQIIPLVRDGMLYASMVHWDGGVRRAAGDVMAEMGQGEQLRKKRESVPGVENVRVRIKEGDRQKGWAVVVGSAAARDKDVNSARVMERIRKEIDKENCRGLAPLVL
jgi:hypothetical protein